MGEVVNLIGQEYVIITLLGVVIGYVITSTPKLNSIKGLIPIIVTLVGAAVGGVQQGLTVDGIVYGAVAGLISTGLYELFGKKLKEFGENEEEVKKAYQDVRSKEPSVIYTDSPVEVYTTSYGTEQENDELEESYEDYNESNEDLDEEYSKEQGQETGEEFDGRAKGGR